MNHRQWSLQTETGPNVTQFLQVSITLHCFLGAPSVLSYTGSEGGAQCHKKREEGEEEVGQIHVSRTMRTKQIVLSFSVEFTFSLPTAMLTPEHNS